MKKILVTIVLLLGALFAFRNGQEDPAIQFLQALSPEQLKKTQLPFADKSREKWHFLPGSMWERAGVRLGELNGNQKHLLSKLLRAYLSESGYDKTQRIIELENVLKSLGGSPVMRNADNYNIAFYGQPGKDKLWSWSFEGHHISLNFTVHDEKITMTPRFLGASPAIIPSGPRKGERTLAREEDLGFLLIQSMTSAQQKVAIFQQQAFSDIVTSNNSTVTPLRPVGILYRDLNPNQQKILKDLIDEYLSAMPKSLAEKRLKQLQATSFDTIRFGWAGATKPGKPHYYRVQGVSFLIEFDNIQNQANHIHTVWRDFDGDFGRDLIREHYQHSGHH